jgi:hypothetical protein
MTLQEFAEITRSVIGQQGFADFQPTLCFPGRHQIRTLAQVPAGVDIEEAAMAWARKHAVAEEEFLVAFKVSDNAFKIVRVLGADAEEATYSASDD